MGTEHGASQVRAMGSPTPPNALSFSARGDAQPAAAPGGCCVQWHPRHWYHLPLRDLRRLFKTHYEYTTRAEYQPLQKYPPENRTPRGSSGSSSMLNGGVGEFHGNMSVHSCVAVARIYRTVFARPLTVSGRSSVAHVYKVYILARYLDILQITFG